MKYSLVDYVLTISIPQKLRSALGLTTISIGGEGTYLDSFSFSMNSDTWSINGDNTGSYIHTKSLNRTGSSELVLNQLAPKVIQLTRLFNLYFSSDVIDEGVTMTLSDADSNTVVTCSDCFIKKLPNIEIQGTPAPRRWTFNCGKIVVN